MRESLADFCRRTGREELLDEWDSERNLPLTPESVSYGSKRHVWWRCANGHSWQAAVYTRSGSGTSCPYCNGRRAIPGETDLATRYPDIASQWHPTKNGDLTPSDVLPGSHRLIWWQCEHGHEWCAQIKSRVSGSGCPVCSNRALLRGENDLATNYPELARQWHPTKNGDLTPSDVVPGTRRQQQKSLVDLRQRPRISGHHRQPHPKRWWLPVLRQYQGASRLQRSRHKISASSRRMAPNQKCASHSRPCPPRQQAQSLVAVQKRPLLASRYLFKNRQPKQRLPILHRLRQRQTLRPLRTHAERRRCPPA